MAVMCPVQLGAELGESGTTFRVWAPRVKDVRVRLFANDGSTVALERRLEPMAMQQREAGAEGATWNPNASDGDDGVFEALVPEAGRGALYKFVLDGAEYPDPYAKFLPCGVHGPAEVVEHVDLSRGRTFRAPPRHAWVIYELHMGTFTAEGTYAAAAARLPELRELGINVIELMPLAAFDGRHGWGYDGVAWFAPHAPYGRPEDLRAFVAAAHEHGIGVLLDAVYNHWGPSGNYFGVYADDYFTDRKSGWGDGPNFEHPRLRAAVLDSARHWLTAYDFDGLRLDATHAIEDGSPRHILGELAELAHGFDPPRLLFAEDERNDPSLVTKYGLDGVWADDFHHAVRVLLTGEQDGYYGAYQPSLETLATTVRQGWLYQGQTNPVTGKPRGAPAEALPFESLLYCIQNHDQVGNRAFGTRLSDDASLEGYLAATMLLLFLPATPLLFMGQEWAASTPFLYFTDHEPELGAKISKGRREEFKSFQSFTDSIPDPQGAATFLRSKLDWQERNEPAHARALALTTALLRLRRTDPVLSAPCSRSELEVRVADEWLVLSRSNQTGRRRLFVRFGNGRMPDIGQVLLASSHDNDGPIALLTA